MSAGVKFYGLSAGVADALRARGACTRVEFECDRAGPIVTIYTRAGGVWCVGVALGPIGADYYASVEDFTEGRPADSIDIPTTTTEAGALAAEIAGALKLEAPRYAVHPWHGEGGSWYHVVDTHAPAGEQPAVVDSHRSPSNAAESAARMNQAAAQ